MFFLALRNDWKQELEWLACWCCLLVVELLISINIDSISQHPQYNETIKGQTYYISDILKCLVFLLVHLSVCQSTQAHIRVTTGRNFFNLGKIMTYDYDAGLMPVWFHFFWWPWMTLYHFTQQYTILQWWIWHFLTTCLSTKKWNFHLMLTLYQHEP